MENLPPLIQEGSYCYCEVGGSLIYREAGAEVGLVQHLRLLPYSQEHPASSNLPRPDVTDLQRRAKQASKNTDQFIETSGDVETDSITQFKLTIESDGLFAATKGLALYNPYSLVFLSKLNEISELIYGALPTKLSSVLSQWYQKEISHTGKG